jgi:GxxExxY protein
MNENEVSYKVIGAAPEVNKTLGPGLLESVYENTLAYELSQNGMQVRTQIPLPVIYKEIKMEAGFRIDFMVENKVIIEIKSIEALAPVHFAQTLTYLKLSGLKLALLLNFNTVKLKDSIHRIVNKL